MKMFIYKTTIMFLLLCRINIIFSQEWQHAIEADTLEYYAFCENATELSNGNLIIPTGYFIRGSLQETHYSVSPSTILLSKDGKELARNNFFRPGYCTISIGQAFEKDNNIYYLTTYSPEHRQESFNYFMNYDNPPSDAKLVLMKLDDELNLVESYEHSWPIDVFEDHGGPWELFPNECSGNIYLFTAFEEDDNIVGAYWKCVSGDHPSRGDDTLFFFRMNFDGVILNKKPVQILEGKKAVNDRALRTNDYRGDHFVATDSTYIFYMPGDGTYYTPGDSIYPPYQGGARAMYYDKEFNLLKTRYFRIPGAQGKEQLQDYNVQRSNHNTTYVTSTKLRQLNGVNDEFCRLYEVDDDINSDLDGLKIVNYIERESKNWDQSSLLSSVELIDDNSLCYVYSLNIGLTHDRDSWIVLEHLNLELDTISTLYYGVDNGMYDFPYNVRKTNDGGVVIVHISRDLYNGDFYSYITKFPASAFGFVSIEEAHAHNLHLAVAYPNPGGDVMNIRTGLRNATLQVYDMQGRIIHQQIITDEVTSVDSSKWNSGTYIWKLTVNNEQLTVEEGKWIK